MKEEIKWKMLINTLLGHKVGQEEEIKSVRIEGKEIIFKASKEVYAKLQEALNNPAILKESVSHILPIVAESEEAQEAESAPAIEAKTFPKLPESAREVVDALVSQDIQEAAGIAQLALENSAPGIASWEIGEENTGNLLEQKVKAKKLEAELAKLDFLRNALKDMDNICDIILGNAEQIKDISGEEDFVSAEVIQVNKINSSKAEIKFNWGRILEEVSAKPEMYGASPFISAKISADGEYSINMDALAYFIPENLGPLLFHKTTDTHGTVFGTKAKDEAEEKSTEAAKFHLLIDHSTSLKGEFHTYIKRIQDTIDSLIENCGDNWEIQITGFGSKLDKTISFDSKKHSAENVKDCIDNIKCKGSTALYDAILSSTTLDSNVNIIFYTDGQNTTGKCDSKDLVKKEISKTRDKNPDFSLTSIGYGQYYDATFFTSVARENGFHHADIRNLDELKDLESHFLGLNGSKALFQFVHDLLIQTVKMQTIKGQVTVTEKVPVGAEIKQGDKEFKFGEEAGAIAAQTTIEAELTRAIMSEEADEFDLLEAPVTAANAPENALHGNIAGAYTEDGAKAAGWTLAGAIHQIAEWLHLA